jgi:PAS domain S-box-containing protein
LLGFLALLIPLFVAGDYFLRFHMILPGFEELEQHEAAKDITRCKRAIEREIQSIEKLSTDWAVWDDLYQYVLDANEAFATSNFQWDTLPTTGIHLIYVINSERKIVYKKAVAPSDKKEVDLRQLPEDIFPADHFLLHSPDDTSSLSGILLTDFGPLLVTSHNIYTSAGGGPSHGTLLFGRFLNDDTIKDLRQQTQVEFTVRDPLSAPFSETEKKRVQDLAAKQLITDIVDDKTMLAFGLLNDLQQQPALLITTTLPRHIMEKGRNTARFSSIVLLSAVGLIILSFITLMAVLHLRSRKRQELIEALIEQRTDELRLAKERLHALSDASFEAIFLFENGVCLEQNRAAAVMFGYSDAEVIGQRAVAGIAPEDRDLVMKNILANVEKPYEVTALRKDGTTFPAQIQARVATYRGRAVRVTALRDISEQKKAEREQKELEDKLQRSQKMESLGLLAGGVAHDLNNILSGIVSYPELILMSLPEDSPLQRPISLIRESGKRAAEVVDDLLTLARGVSSSRENSNLNTIITDYLGSPEFINLQGLHGHVLFKTELEPELLNISCSPIHIKKCIMNLVTNAAEAIKEPGEIRISTRNQYMETPLEGHPEMQKGEYAVFSVADSGTGIPEESLDRIFEPFYSRKVAGRSGTGLGLAIAWNTVHDHDGGITVESSSTGTTFELYFPATRENLNILPESIDIEQYRGNREKILVVDDDERQRTIAIQILDLLNYSGHAVDSGESSVRYLSENTVDLVVLDMIMDPGMNGCETYRRILELHPGQKAIITSGFSESSDVRQALSLGAKGFVKKPYLVSRIAVTIHDTLRNH